MRNKIVVILLCTLGFAASVYADTASVALDTIEKPFIPPNTGPLGIDTTTGVALFEAAILFAILAIALWRSTIMKRRSTNG